MSKNQQKKHQLKQQQRTYYVKTKHQQAKPDKE